MASRADEYRRLARECLAIANSGVTAKTRASLVAMAEVWSRLADEQKQIFPRPSTVQAPQPVTQQQQQPQAKKTDTDKE
jgi:hypothetical protein